MNISRDLSLNQKAYEFIDRLKALENEPLELSVYNKAYLKRYLQSPLYNLYLACFNLELAEDLTKYNKIIDLGGGIGFNTAFLKSLNSDAEIIYIDVDPDSASAAQYIHQALGLKADRYVIGDIELLANDVDSQTLILSRDVIEHIYDLPHFFNLSAKAGRNVHNTAAILGSFFRANEFKKIHHQAEYIGNRLIEIKARDHRESYFNMRKNLIKSFKADIDDTSMESLAKATRGLIENDIQKFISSGRLPLFHQESLHTNTCDPITGNWAERLLSKENYIKMAAPLTIEFYYPKYNALDNSGLRRMALATLNIFTKLPIHKLQPSFSIVY